MNRKTRALALIIIALLATLWFPSFSAVCGQVEDVLYSIKSTVRYSNPSQSRVWNLSEDDRSVGLYMNNTWQTVELLNSTLSVDQIKNDEDGNPVALLGFPEQALKPRENVSFTVWYNVISKPRTIPDITEEKSLNLTDIPAYLVNEFTREEGPWQTSNSTLRDLAFSLKRNETNVLTIIRSFVSWMKASIKYPQAPHEYPFYPNETYTEREGDCDDQAILLVTLARIVGIPSYLQTGCIYLPEDALVNETYWDGHVYSVERRIGWHAWAIVYVPPWGWLPVDLTYVTSDYADPLSSIRYAAVAEQSTVQYMNVSRFDYVADSRQTGKFILENGFFVDLEDEMMVEVPKNTVDGRINPTILEGSILAVAIILASSLLMVHRRHKRLEKKEIPASEPAYV
jgi:hypothetical protein